MDALAKAGHPTVIVQARGPEDLGRVFFLSEFATAVVGWVLEINPFDQPNVQQAKDATKRVLDEGAPELDDGDLSALLGGLEPPAYLAIMGYLPYSDEIEAAVTRLREKVIAARHVSTTYGYGPRFLHSTGQFHKGGPAVGRFLQLVHDADADARDPRRRVRLPDADLGAGRRRPPDLARPRPGGRARASQLPGPARVHRRPRGGTLMQIGFVGLGKMGGNMVHRIHRDSDHQVVAFDLNDEHVREAEGHGATAASSLEDARRQARRAADGVDHGPGRRPDAVDDRPARRRARRRRHDHRRRQHEVARRRHARGGALRARHPLRRRRHLGRRLGPRGRLLHDGRRASRVGRAARPRSSTCSPRRTAGATSATRAPGTS